MILKRTIALCFVILFTLIISAPTIIVSCDDSADISSFFGMNEEEEQEDIKLLFDQNIEELEDFSLDTSIVELIWYTSNKYHKPHLNLISPPPEKHLA
ncbi:hypothetical protein [Winogradskyella sp. MH6]|uniref:hypothetical protein n=1 Tax=Winogradskyella sp. MH6 TaxID=2929510 RepID=UPI001FB30ABA|nr:hypothetical protein [Winogradskyella sp. MH6]